MARVLVVEDDSAVRAFVRRALEMDRHEVVEAEDGEEGFDTLQNANGAFDLLLSDIKMPFMDGIELARLSSQHFPDLPVLLMTGYADQRERVEASSTVVDVVSKPFPLKTIRKAVLAALSPHGCHDLSGALPPIRKTAVY
ncbi:MAG: response regulator [Pseudomonadota bacterium]